MPQASLSPVREPAPADPHWPRYSTRAFPASRYVPGAGPRPRGDPHGQAFAEPETADRAVPPERWRQCEEYLYGVDLFNHAYWWECHEVFEGLWRAAGRPSQQGRFLQGLIQLAAANLKWFVDEPAAAGRLALRALEKFAGLPETYMGVAIGDLRRDARARVEDAREAPPRIRLDL